MVVNEKLEEKTCPYCGQVVIAEEGVDPRRRCRCAEAVRYSANAEILEDMEDQLDELFAEGCDENSPVFIPIDRNTYAVLHNLILLESAGLIEKASVTMPDGSVFSAKGHIVNRKITVKG
jgi:hypothetical protein